MYLIIEKNRMMCLDGGYFPSDCGLGRIRKSCGASEGG